MRLYLASYFEPENHGSGRKIGISPDKPNGIECQFMFEQLSPGDVYWQYHKDKHIIKNAGSIFEKNYRKKLDEFYNAVIELAETDSVNPMERLPFKEGDTLLTWEKAGHTTYRNIVAEYLRKFGYEVIER